MKHILPFFYTLVTLFVLSTTAMAGADGGSLYDRSVEGSSQKIFDAFVEQGMPSRELRAAFDYFNAHASQISNQQNLVLVDFSKTLSESRFYILDLTTGKVKKSQVSHGLGSDPDSSGRSVLFSDLNGSNMSSLGFYLTLSPYSGEYGYSLRVRGLSAGNRSALARTIVIHGYPIGPEYDQAACRREKVAAGRPQSQKHCLHDGALTRGCFGLPRSIIRSVVDQLAGGTLIYAFN